MEAVCWRIAEHLRLWAPHIYHAIAVFVLGLASYFEDPDSVVDTINVFLLPDLYPSASSEAALFARRWGATLGSGALTSFANTSLLLKNKKFDPVTIWGAEE